MNTDHPAQIGPIPDFDITAKLGSIGDSATIAYPTVVRDMNISHYIIVVTNNSICAFACRAVNCSIFMELIAITDNNTRIFTKIIPVHRCSANNHTGSETTIFTHLHPAFKSAERPDLSSRAKSDIRPNNRGRMHLC